MRSRTTLPPGPDLFEDCDHTLRSHGRYGVIACARCAMAEWFGPLGPVDPAEAMAALFGSFNLIDQVSAVGAPARSVLAYKPSRSKRSALSVLPHQTWFPSSPDLWIATDGDLLFLATSNQLMVDNLTRGA